LYRKIVKHVVSAEKSGFVVFAVAEAIKQTYSTIVCTGNASTCGVDLDVNACGSRD